MPLPLGVVESVTDAKVQIMQDQDGKFHGGRVHFGFKGDTVLSELTGRRNKPVEWAKPHIRSLLNLHGVNYTKMLWSQNAGCGCGCSPGFKLPGATATLPETGVASQRFNFFVTFETKETPDLGWGI